MNPPFYSYPLRCATAAHYSETARQEWLTLTAAGSLDWTALVNEAETAGLLPTLHEAWRLTPNAPIPDDTVQQMRRAYLQTALNNTLILSELTRVLRRFNQQGIPIILLKGAALLHTAYKNPALRPMFDLDLLIPFSHLAAAEAQLAQLEFAPGQPPHFVDESGLCWNERLFHKEELTLFVLELHWRLLDIPYYAAEFELDYLWRRSRPITVNGQPARTLGLEDQLLHLCSHNYYHHGGRLGQVNADLAALITAHGDEIDWSFFLKKTAAADLSLVVRETLCTAVDHWFLSLPPDATAAIRRLRPRAREHFFAYCQRSDSLKHIRAIVTLPGWRLKWRYLWRQIFPGREYMLWRYEADAQSWLPRMYLRRFVEGGGNWLRELGRR
jgi:hypothetical protein